VTWPKTRCLHVGFGPCEVERLRSAAAEARAAAVARQLDKQAVAATSAAKTAASTIAELSAAAAKADTERDGAKSSFRHEQKAKLKLAGEAAKLQEELEKLQTQLRRIDTDRERKTREEETSGKAKTRKKDKTAVAAAASDSWPIQVSNVRVSVSERSEVDAQLKALKNHKVTLSVLLEKERAKSADLEGRLQAGGLHSSTSQLILSRFVTETSVSTQRIPQNVLTSSRKVDVCKPLGAGH